MDLEVKELNDRKNVLFDECIKVRHDIDHYGEVLRMFKERDKEIPMGLLGLGSMLNKEYREKEAEYKQVKKKIEDYRSKCEHDWYENCRFSEVCSKCGEVYYY